MPALNTCIVSPHSAWAQPSPARTAATTCSVVMPLLPVLSCARRAMATPCERFDAATRRRNRTASRRSSLECAPAPPRCRWPPGRACRRESRRRPLRVEASGTPGAEPAPGAEAVLSERGGVRIVVERDGPVKRRLQRLHQGKTVPSGQVRRPQESPPGHISGPRQPTPTWSSSSRTPASTTKLWHSAARRSTAAASGPNGISVGTPPRLSCTPSSRTTPAASLVRPTSMAKTWVTAGP